MLRKFMKPSGEMSHIATARDPGQGVSLSTEQTQTLGLSIQAQSGHWDLAGVCTHHAACLPPPPQAQTPLHSAGDFIDALKRPETTNCGLLQDLRLKRD